MIKTFCLSQIIISVEIKVKMHQKFHGLIEAHLTDQDALIFVSAFASSKDLV